jgi:hypothetical protein
VLLTDDDKRTLPGLMHFTGHQLDVGMAATGLMIAMLRSIYAFFRTMIRA